MDSAGDTAKTNTRTMWLIPPDEREEPRILERYKVPEEETAILFAVASGDACDHQKKEFVEIVRKLRELNLWLACNCRLEDEVLPLVRCCRYRGGQSYGLARFASDGPRPSHSADCPFHGTTRIRVDANKNLDPSDFGFSGGFRAIGGSVLAGDGEGSVPGKTSKNLPKIVRMLISLLEAGEFNQIVFKGHGTKPADLYGEFDRLKRAATNFDIVKGVINLSPALTSAINKMKGVNFQRYISGLFKTAHLPEETQGFLTFYTKDVSDKVLTGPTGRVTLQEPPVLAPNTSFSDFKDAPSLSLVCYGPGRQGERWKPYKAVTVPVLSGRSFVPVQDRFERKALKLCIEACKTFKANYPTRHVVIKQSFLRLFDGPTDAGDFTITVHNPASGQQKTVHCFLDRPNTAQVEKDARAERAKPLYNADWYSVFLVEEDDLNKADEFKTTLTYLLRI